MGKAGRGKKRIRRLAEWHWKGGDAGTRYCSLLCEAEKKGRCNECPYVINEPTTDEGEAVWELLTRCGSQVRVAPVGAPGGGAITRPIGLDFGTVIAMGAALSIEAELLADVLPSVERAMLSGLEDDVDIDDD